MICTNISTDIQNCDKQIDSLFFAVREVPQASTGISLLSSCMGEGPMTFWTCKRKHGQRVEAKVKILFNTCWTCEQSSSHSVKLHTNICSTAIQQWSAIANTCVDFFTREVGGDGQAKCTPASFWCWRCVARYSIQHTFGGRNTGHRSWAHTFHTPLKFSYLWPIETHRYRENKLSLTEFQTVLLLDNSSSSTTLRSHQSF